MGIVLCRGCGIERVDESCAYRIAKQVCEDLDIEFIDVFSDFLKLKYVNLLEDGLYPNSKGHKIVYEKVKEVLNI